MQSGRWDSALQLLTEGVDGPSVHSIIENMKRVDPIVHSFMEKVTREDPILHSFVKRIQSGVSIIEKVKRCTSRLPLLKENASVE